MTQSGDIPGLWVTTKQDFRGDRSWYESLDCVRTVAKDGTERYGDMSVTMSVLQTGGALQKDPLAGTLAEIDA